MKSNKKQNIINSLLIIIFLIIISSACDDTGPTEIPLPDKNVSFSQHIQPLFNNYCNNTGCHNAQDGAGEIRLTSYGDLFATPFLVIPRAPEESTLYLSVSGQTVNIMPPPYGNTFPLNDNQINGIRVWIEEGAEAN